MNLHLVPQQPLWRLIEVCPLPQLSSDKEGFIFYFARNCFRTQLAIVLHCFTQDLVKLS